MSETLKELCSTKVLRMWVDERQHTLVIETDQGRICYCLEADCCSESWFSDFIDMDNLLGCDVFYAEPVKITEDETSVRSRQDSDQIYSIKLRTKNGYSEIVFRNSSNGYYGGSLQRSNFVPDITGYIEITSDVTF